VRKNPASYSFLKSVKKYEEKNPKILSPDILAGTELLKHIPFALF
jgi:hypothetical protein